MTDNDRGNAYHEARVDEVEDPSVLPRKPQDQVKLSFEVPKSIRTRIKKHATKVERTVREIAVEALDEYLSRRDA